MVMEMNMELATTFIQHALHRSAYGLGANNGAILRIVVVMIVWNGVITVKKNELLVAAHGSQDGGIPQRIGERGGTERLAPRRLPGAALQDEEE